MFRLLKRTFFVLFLSSFIFLTAHAELGDIALQPSTSSPRPYSTITVRATATNTDLDIATFTWYVGGKVFSKGKGITSIDVKTGKAGSAIKVSVDITTTNLGRVSRELTIRPLDITLVWKSDGYIPPFYKGKALEGYGGKFTVTAIPEFFTSAGTRIDSKNLLYTWKKNDVIDPNQSGLGKDIYTSVQSSYTRGEDEISVLVTTQTDDMSSSKKTFIEPQIPEIVFYENSPLYGVMYENALLSQTSLKSEEVTLHASPFNLAFNGIDRDKVSIQWNMNGVDVPDFMNKHEIVLRKNGGNGGQTEIGVLMQHADKLLQGGRASITILQ